MVASPSRSEGERARDPAVAKVGFIGLGEMGGAIATRIIRAGWPTVLWARRPDVLAEFVAPNVTSAGTPREVAAEADLIGICVWADADVREVLVGETGVLADCRPGTIVAIHSTVLPRTCREIASAARDRGVFVIDAPVTGGRDVALAGSLAIATGGDSAAITRARPVFEAFASRIVRVGDVGGGQVAKLLNNALFAANVAVADDALTLGAAVGVDTTELAQFLRDGSGRSYGLDIAERFRASADTRQAALPALDKDVRSLADEAAAEGLDSASLRSAAAEAVRRLRDPPPGWLA